VGRGSEASPLFLLRGGNVAEKKAGNPSEPGWAIINDADQQGLGTYYVKDLTLHAEGATAQYTVVPTEAQFFTKRPWLPKDWVATGWRIIPVRREKEEIRGNP
jgi:hypothetical protein